MFVVVVCRGLMLCFFLLRRGLTMMLVLVCVMLLFNGQMGTPLMDAHVCQGGRRRLHFWILLVCLSNP